MRPNLRVDELKFSKLLKLEAPPAKCTLQGGIARNSSMYSKVEARTLTCAHEDLISHQNESIGVEMRQSEEGG